MVDNGDGTITVRTEVTGVSVRLTLSDGTIAAMDVGRVVLVSVIDYHGTPTNPDDDEPVSQTIESVAGPHPVLESEGALFCEVVVAGLT